MTQPKSHLFALELTIGLIMNLLPQLSSAKDPAQDRYLWLEEIRSDQALDWVKKRNQITLDELTSDPRYNEIEAEIKKIVFAKDRLPMPHLSHQWIYNFWQDEKSVQGIWRRTSRQEYQKESPQWETLIDLDKLSKEESETWVWHGANCLPPDETRCLVSLSRGGKDASVVREFDVEKKLFLKDGFTLPEAKSSVYWKDLDTLWVATDFGPGTTTESGYPKQVKLWKRNTPLASAEKIFEGQYKDAMVFGFTSFSPSGNTHMINRTPSFFESETWIWKAGEPLEKVPFPLDFEVQGAYQGRVFGRLRTDWTRFGSHFSAGTIVALDLNNLEHGKPEKVFQPSAKQSIPHLSFTKEKILLTIYEQVVGKLYSLERNKKGVWKSTELPYPNHGSIGMISSSEFEEDYVAQYSNFLTPPTLYLANSLTGKKDMLKQATKRFDEAGLTVKQYFATSSDQTKIPYFVVFKDQIKLDSTHPTLLTGYGGFEASMTPYYLGLQGKVWLEKGGVFVLANIRGGGEFGPKWHEAVLKENRQKAFDDFAAVARDLIDRKITSAQHLGIQGGSNGGLLMGVSFTQHPELFQAVICQVPLLDMTRYQLFLTGPMWEAEYGTVDDPKMKEVLLRYSPYQNLSSEKKYPKVFFLTSTADDRVHPGHARKMAALMEEYHHPFYYYENIEGGHGGSANLDQVVKQLALQYTYLFRMLTVSAVSSNNDEQRTH